MVSNARAIRSAVSGSEDGLGRLVANGRTICRLGFCAGRGAFFVGFFDILDLSDGEPLTGLARARKRRKSGAERAFSGGIGGVAIGALAAIVPPNLPPDRPGARRALCGHHLSRIER